MRAIEIPKFQTVPRLQARYGGSRSWLERHIKNYGSPLPIKFGGIPDGARRSISCTNFRWPIGSSPSESAPCFRRPASTARKTELDRINGDAS
jgi:hypothetical protein